MNTNIAQLCIYSTEYYCVFHFCYHLNNLARYRRTIPIKHCRGETYSLVSIAISSVCTWLLTNYNGIYWHESLLWDLICFCLPTSDTKSWHLNTPLLNWHAGGHVQGGTFNFVCWTMPFSQCHYCLQVLHLARKKLYTRILILCSTLSKCFLVSNQMCSFHILISGVFSAFEKYRQEYRETMHNQYLVQGCVIQTILYLIFLLVAVLQPQVVIMTTYGLHKHNETQGGVCVCVWVYTI